MQPLEDEAAQRLLEDLVPMPEAALLAHLSAFGIDRTISRLDRDDMAQTLARLLPVYAVSADGRSVHRLEPAALEGGVFADAGKVLRFADGRADMTGLHVTRSALKAAVAAVKDAKRA